MQTEYDSFAARIVRAQNGDAEAERELLKENLPLVSAIDMRGPVRNRKTCGSSVRSGC